MFRSCYWLLWVAACCPPVQAHRQHRSNTHFFKKHGNKIRTFLTLSRPTSQKVAEWFDSREVQFNHDCVGMTNPCLHISTRDTQSDGNKVVHVGVKTTSGETLSISSWWPTGNGPPRGDKSWRVICLRRRVGSGDECYERVRDAALQWDFHSSRGDHDREHGSKNNRKAKELGIYSVQPKLAHPRATDLSEREKYWRRECKSGYDIVHSPCIGEVQGMDASQVSRDSVLPIWSSPGGRRLATYSEASFGGRSVLRLFPRVYAVNPVTVVYDLVDQRGPRTTYSSTAYATTKGHWLSGEERVTVACRDGTEKHVDVEIMSYSRPAPSLWGKIVWPAIGKMQRNFFESQMDALEEVARKTAPQLSNQYTF